MISDRAVLTIARFAFDGRGYCRLGDPYIRYLQYWQNRKQSKLLEMIAAQKPKTTMNHAPGSI